MRPKGAEERGMSEDQESLLEFPCEFPIKIIGKAGCDLDAIVFTLVRPHVPDLSEGAIRSRLSKEGRYQSVTLTITAQSRAQLDAIYMALTASEYVIMAL
jgi:putative lipoic acid-binding regulatory protein